MIKCQTCAREQEPRLLCAQCGGPLGATLDCFAALGLPRKLTIDPLQLENVYHDLGRRIHPDRFAGKSVRLRDASLRATALLTRSYRTLREPVSRGLYWLELNGHKLAENNQNVPADLAETVFEVQEQLAEMRAARDRGGEAAERLRGEVEIQRTEIDRMIEQARHELGQNFARWDALPDVSNIHSDARPDAHGIRSDAPSNAPGLLTAAGARDALVAELKSVLSKLAYLRTLIRDIDRELDSAQAA